MAIFQTEEREFAESVSNLAHCNPFLPERLDCERQALGSQFVDDGIVWSRRSAVSLERKNIQLLVDRVRDIVFELRQRIDANPNELEEDEKEFYADLVLFHLYHSYRDQYTQSIVDTRQSMGAIPTASFWKPFCQDYNHLRNIPGQPTLDDASHWFAVFFQLRRTFDSTFGDIVGESMPAAQLRAAIWQSVFTHDMRRYRRTLFRTMGDITTLIIGPSGTGKELAARAIGHSRYIPFNEKTSAFEENFVTSFQPLNLSALSPTLIESELFGHVKGAFTGAISDRVGWLESCPTLGTVFLDEIGELDGQIQVKLLRVLQARTFQRLGCTQNRRFHGKIIAATNRNLQEEMSVGAFRHDLYYRLCADIVQTPGLREQLVDSPEDLHALCRHIAINFAPDEADALADETTSWIRANLPSDYSWPGNFRELEQCLRNVMIRSRYVPTLPAPKPTLLPEEALLVASEQGQLSAEELMQRYCTLIYSQLGNYEQAAKKLGLDRRTVKAKVDDEFLARLKSKE